MDFSTFVVKQMVGLSDILVLRHKYVKRSVKRGLEKVKGFQRKR
jgi:hypothetical protein